MSAVARAEPRWKYLGVANTAFQQAIAYRMTTLLNIALTFIWVFILTALWSAAYADRELIAGYTWSEMRTYVLLAYALNALVGWRVGSNMIRTIQSGDILRDQVRPLNYCGTQLALAAGYAIVEGFLSLLIALVLGVVVLDIEPPASPAMAALFLVAIFLGFLTKALVMFCVSLVAFWTMNGVGVMWAQQAIIAILSGTIVPIALLPAWLRVIAEVLPLRGIVNTPVSLYLGTAGAGEAAGLIGLQVLWVAVLWVFANWAWRRAFRAVEIQGG